MQGLDGVPKRRWDDDPSKATHVGPQFPDLFQKAMQGSHLADNISVQYDGEDRRSGGNTNASLATSGVSSRPVRNASAGADASPSGVVGSTIGAPASKKRWRKGR